MMKILFVCHGNICRSPMAEFVFRQMLKERGLDKKISVESGATSTEELGNPVHPGTRRKLNSVGVPMDPNKRSWQISKLDYSRYDMLIGMDSMNVSNMRRMLGGDPENKICKLLDFTGRSRDIADPWYTGNFDETYADVVEGCKALMDYLTGDK